MLHKLKTGGLGGDGYGRVLNPQAGGMGDPVTEPLPVATNGADTLIGGDLGDLLDGKAGNDSLQGMRGEDTLYGRGGNDWIGGAWGNDMLYGGAGNDTLWGGDNRDLVVGGAGNDLVQGYTGPDTLLGGSGDDWLAGGVGGDVFIGGDGADRFELERGLGQDLDMFVDFNPGEDVIALRYPGGFGINHTGAMEAADFALGRYATGLSTRILYDRATGDILFDGNGYPGGGPEEGYVIGHVAAGTDLNYTDFWIYYQDYPY